MVESTHSSNLGQDTELIASTGIWAQESMRLGVDDKCAVWM